MLYTNKILILGPRAGLLSQKAIAHKAGVKVGTLQNFINGKNPTLETIEKISEALGVSPVIWFQKDDLIINEKPAEVNEYQQLYYDQLRENDVLMKQNLERAEGYIEQLKKELENCQRDKITMRADFDLLLEKHGISKVGT